MQGTEPERMEKASIQMKCIPQTKNPKNGGNFAIRQGGGRAAIRLYADLPPTQYYTKLTCFLKTDFAGVEYIPFIEYLLNPLHQANMCVAVLAL